MALTIKLVKVLGKVAVWLLAGLVLVYILLIIINWQDEEPAAAARTMQTLQQQAAEQAADANGYLYFRQHAGMAGLEVSDGLRELLRQCPGTGCHAALTALQPDLAAVITQHQPLTEFYQQLRRYSQWHEPVPADPAEAFPTYQNLLLAQQLLLLQAWQAVQLQDLSAVQLLLQQDLQFWRLVLAKNNLLLGKMVSVAAIKRHFEFANVIKQQLTAEQHSVIVPDSWLQPFTAAELSLLQVFSGEWAYSNMAMESTLLTTAAEADVSAAEYFAQKLLKPLFLPQATRNQRARQLLAQARAEQPQRLPWYSWLYNPVGKLLNSADNAFYARYHGSLLELDGFRQQALLRQETASSSTAL